MTSVDRTGAAGGPSAADGFPTKNLPRPTVKDMPPAPVAYRKLIGPGIIAAGVGLASGEFILYPYIASQVGLVFVWAALVGLGTQFFINLEIERYTLATGETALTGFSRYWRHWGLVFAIMTYFANLWPGWATSSATLVSYIFGGTPRFIAIGMLLAIGLILTLAPVVYVALERAQMLKVAAVLLLFVVSAIFAIGAEAWAALPQIVTQASIPASSSGSPCCSAHWPSPAAVAGRTWCRPTGSGTRVSAWAATCPRLVSPVTGQPEAAPSTGYIFEPDDDNMSRWKGWWKFANIEQLSTFVLITFVTILFTSLLAYSTVYGTEGPGQQHRLHQDRGRGAGRAGRELVQVLLLVHRRLLAVRRGDGHRRLHQPAGRGRDQDLLRCATPTSPRCTPDWCGA